MRDSFERPVERSDGAWYPDIDDAAWELAREGLCPDECVARNAIRRVCDGRERRRTAYGYGWRWAQPWDTTT